MLVQASTPRTEKQWWYRKEKWCSENTKRDGRRLKATGWCRYVALELQAFMLSRGHGTVGWPSTCGRWGRSNVGCAHAFFFFFVCPVMLKTHTGSRHSHSKNSLVWTPGTLCRFDVAWRCLARKDWPPVKWTIRSSADLCCDFAPKL